MLSRSVREYLSRVSNPLICERIVLSSDSLRFCFICSLSSSDSFSFFTLSWFNIFSSQRRAFTFRSLAPPEITPDFWKRVPSRDTDYTARQKLLNIHIDLRAWASSLLSVLYFYTAHFINNHSQLLLLTPRLD